MGEDVLAIVGSEKWTRPWRAQAQAIIEGVLDRRRPSLVVSGGAFGVDKLAAQLADARSIQVVEFLPRNRRWKPDGFEARNELIAQTCTRLLCIRDRDSRTYGSGWTADRAEALGKLVWRVILPLPDLPLAPKPPELPPLRPGEEPLEGFDY